MGNMDHANWVTQNLCPYFGCCCKGPWHFCGCIDKCNCCVQGYCNNHCSFSESICFGWSAWNCTCCGGDLPQGATKCGYKICCFSCPCCVYKSIAPKAGITALLLLLTAQHVTSTQLYQALMTLAFLMMIITAVFVVRGRHQVTAEAHLEEPLVHEADEEVPRTVKEAP